MQEEHDVAGAPEVAVSGTVAKLPVQQSGQELFSLTDLMEQYWYVSRCWADHSLAVKDNMTFETAVDTLRRVRDQARHHPGGNRLSRMAWVLMTDIVERTEDVPEVNSTFCTECNRHTDHPGFDGCMQDPCPLGYEPCL